MDGTHTKQYNLVEVMESPDHKNWGELGRWVGWRLAFRRNWANLTWPYGETEALQRRCRGVTKALQNVTKRRYKTLQNVTKQHEALQNNVPLQGTVVQ